MKRFFPLVTLAALAVMDACERPQEKPSSTPTSGGGLPTVYAVNYPLAYFVQRIGGHEINVVYDAPKDVDPAFWQPTDGQITSMQNAGLILMNGATYSKWAEKVTLPETKVVDTSSAFQNKFIVVKNAVTHSHGKQGEHSHDGITFTTWIDFHQAIMQADAIAEACKRLKPEALEQFAQGFDALKIDLLALDARMESVGKKLAGQPVVASHPIYQYWARRYGINLQSVLWEPEEVPTEVQMDDLKKILAAHSAKLMIWEGQPAKESVEKLKALGLVSVVFYPCANSPATGDFLSVMRDNVAAMEKISSSIP